MNDGSVPGADVMCAHWPAGLGTDVQQCGNIPSQEQGKADGAAQRELMLRYHPAANSANRWLLPLHWQLPEPL